MVSGRLAPQRILVSCCIAAVLAASLPLRDSSASTHDQNELINLAKAAVISEVERKTLPNYSKKTPAQAVFVTIERNGSVIGCRGGLEPRSRWLEEEIVLSAKAAAGHDPRYRPLTPRDLEGFKVTVTVIEKLIPIDNVDTLLPSDGLVLKSGTKTGVVLPWEGKDPKVRLKWAYKKAGIEPGSSCKLLRMRAERFRG